MRTISIVTGGSRGDVQPYVALGAGLKSAGHAVRLLASANFETLVTDAGLSFHSTGEDIEALLQGEAWRKTMERGNFLAILAHMRSEMRQHARRTARDLPPLLAGSDLILTGMAGIAGTFAVAGMLAIPVLQAYVVPFTPTRAFPSPLVPNLPLGGTLNRLSFHVMRQLFWQSFKVSDVATRRALGLRQGSFWGPFRSLARSNAPVLYGYSPSILPRPDDWTDQHYVTGYWFLDAPSDWTPPVELVDFLQAGEPPVYIGFGSMGSRNPHEAGQIALEALERSGQRGILATGWGGLTTAELPDTVHLVSSIPHSWLLPRTRAVVHHGGAGTTAAALRAGVPSIVVPFMGEQAFWGQRVADLGAGPAPIPRRALTGQRLANAITESIRNAQMRRQAHAIGRQLRAEDGIGAAVAIVDRFLSQRGAVHRPLTTAS